MSFTKRQQGNNIENAIKFGTIKSVEGQKAIVDCGAGAETPLVPWPTFISATTAIAWTPVPGQPCAIACPGGDLSHARIIAIYPKEGEAVGNDFTIKISGNPEFATGVAKITGGVESTDDQIAGGISQINHVHSGIQPGGANTGKPS